jgi:hypothetical protein
MFNGSNYSYYRVEKFLAFPAAWSGWVGFPLAVRRFAGPVFGVSVPVAVPPSLRLAPPPALPAPVAWARAA